ncbi:MAG: hypothetical protein KTR26_09715 [Flammeovirgaceae bacterium]|nr:hypothetical protein [Flammeovirgaceae bacterium]
MEGIIALCIPIVAILCGSFITVKRMNMKSGGLTTGDKKELNTLKIENQQLKKRLENLEIIVSEIPQLKE